MCEREDANRTRVVGHLDEIQGVVANTQNSLRNGAVGFIDWLDDYRGGRRVAPGGSLVGGLDTISNVIGMSTSFHLPGFQRQRPSATIAELLRLA